MQNCIDFRIYEQCNKTNCANHFNKLSLEYSDKSIKFLRKNNSAGTYSNLKSDAPESFLMSTMVDIVKNKQANISCVNNYRAMALSLLGRILDRLFKCIAESICYL